MKEFTVEITIKSTMDNIHDEDADKAAQVVQMVWDGMSSEQRRRVVSRGVVSFKLTEVTRG